MPNCTVSATEPIPFVDSHVHLDLLLKEAPERVAWLAHTGCLPVSWSFGRDIRDLKNLKRYLNNQSETIANISQTRFRSYFLIGVHPRNIPPDLRPEHVKELILPFLDDPLCLGIGEIGLETAAAQEVAIFRAHMEMAEEAAQRGKVIGIHTPRKDKGPVTDRIISILEGFSAWKDRIVVDHCTPGTIGRVFALGCWAGITLSPQKSFPEDVVGITETHPGQSGRIMLNTDSGNILHEDLYEFCRSNALPEGLKKDLTRNNALRFFGLDRGPRRG